MKRQKGFTPTIILIFMGLVVILAAAGSYYYLKAIGKAPSVNMTTMSDDHEAALNPATTPTPPPTPISGNDDPDTLQAELDSTVISSPENDFNDLESSASQL